MAAFDFPASPTLNQTYTANGVTYRWNGQAWVGNASVSVIDFISLPAGMVFQWLLDTPPDGTLELKGQTVSRTTYSKLFALWGTKYGAGDGSTTFGLPNTAGTAFVGKDTGAARLGTAFGYNATLVGAVFGIQAETLAIGDLPAHGHIQTAHQHSIAYSNATTISTSGSGFTRSAATGFSGLFTTIDGGGDATQAAGGGSWHGNVQPSFVALHVVTTGGQV